jgi:hypothetical protein
MSKENGKTKKSDSPDGMILSISKSQKNAAKRLAQKAKAPLVQRGGCCPACGQRSTSCSTHTEHEGCSRRFSGTFAHPALVKLSERAELFGDGSPSSAAVPSVWMPIEMFQERLESRAVEATLRLAYREVHVVPIKRESDHTEVVFQDGLGQPLFWVKGAWSHIEDKENPGLSEKPSCDEMEPIPGVAA